MGLLVAVECQTCLQQFQSYSRQGQEVAQNCCVVEEQQSFTAMLTQGHCLSLSGAGPEFVHTAVSELSDVVGKLSHWEQVLIPVGGNPHADGSTCVHCGANSLQDRSVSSAPCTVDQTLLFPPLHLSPSLSCTHELHVCDYIPTARVHNGAYKDAKWYVVHIVSADILLQVTLTWCIFCSPAYIGSTVYSQCSLIPYMHIHALVKHTTQGTVYSILCQVKRLSAAVTLLCLGAWQDCGVWATKWQKQQEMSNLVAMELADVVQLCMLCCVLYGLCVEIWLV